MHAWRPMADSEFRCQDAHQQERVYSSTSVQAGRPLDATPEADRTHPNRILVMVAVLQVVITILLIACLAVDVRFVNDAHRKISKHEGEFEEFMKVYSAKHQEAVTSDLRRELTLKANTILAEYNHILNESERCSEEIQTIKNGLLKLAETLEELNASLGTETWPNETYPCEHTDRYESSNGYLYTLVHKQTTYLRAKAKCAEMQSGLATEGMRNVELRREIIENLRLAGMYYMWIGLDDLVEEENWVWVDGVSSNASNTAWDWGEPNDHGGLERCGSFLPEQSGVINDMKCSVHLPYLCEATQ